MNLVGATSITTTTTITTTCCTTLSSSGRRRGATRSAPTSRLGAQPGRGDPSSPAEPDNGPAEYGPAGPGRLEALSGRLGRRKGVGGPKKERRRTESINSAFAELRECIPNVPADTKLSKIKTLRLSPPSPLPVRCLTDVWLR
uniref:Heart- and neural crest derivatives-expressed protein 1 n=1 Tax=Malurus cyaneus samueli TaxID=2593467 RepID=A0A8C5U752_9PASS